MDAYKDLMNDLRDEAITSTSIWQDKELADMLNAAADVIEELLAERERGGSKNLFEEWRTEQDKVDPMKGSIAPNILVLHAKIEADGSIKHDEITPDGTIIRKVGVVDLPKEKEE